MFLLARPADFLARCERRLRRGRDARRDGRRRRRVVEAVSMQATLLSSMQS
jgi:hypothetical protein